MTDGAHQGSLRACRVFFIEALEASDSAVHELSQANTSARTAKPSDCAKCLGALGIQCPLKYGDDGVDSEALQILRDIPLLESKRLRKALATTKTKDTSRDSMLAAELTRAGFAQNMEHFSVPAPSTDNNASNLVADPRSAEQRNRPQQESLEERPLCAKSLNKFLKQRRATIEGYRPKRSTEPGSHPIDHSTDEETWKVAVGEASMAQITDCAKCLGENCPLLHGVEPKRFYDSVNKSRHLPSGRAIRATEVILRITSGRMRGAETQESLENLDSNLKRKADESASS